MALAEFEIIHRYFSAQGAARADVACGVGDDGAVLRVPPDRELVVSLDTLVEAVHFPAATPAGAVGYKALAVGLSDLAAMGAEPAWLTLGLTLPRPDASWLEAFSAGLGGLAARHGLALVGGDLTRGPLAVTVQVHGLVPPGGAVLRRGARPGDGIYVTGELGAAAAAVAHLRGELSLPPDLAVVARRRLERPQPRVAEALALRGLVRAAIDVSDGLLADLGHILEASGVGARLELQALPLHEVLQALAPRLGLEICQRLALTGGDDYELCFVAPVQAEAEIRARLAALRCPVARVGVIEVHPGLRCRQADGRLLSCPDGGYEHFHE